MGPNPAMPVTVNLAPSQLDQTHLEALISQETRACCPNPGRQSPWVLSDSCSSAQNSRSRRSESRSDDLHPTHSGPKHAQTHSTWNFNKGWKVAAGGNNQVQTYRPQKTCYCSKALWKRGRNANHMFLTNKSGRLCSHHSSAVLTLWERKHLTAEKWLTSK